MPGHAAPSDPLALHYRQVLDSARDFAILATDRDGFVTTWNAGAQALLGWSEEEMLGASADCIFTEEDRAAGAPQAERTTALRQGYAADERWHMRRNGETFWASGQLTPLISNGAVTGFVKVLRDRTEQKRADEKLRRLNDTLESLVAQRTRERDRLWRNTPDLLLVIAPDGVLHAANPAWAGVLGYSEDELLGQPFSRFVHPDDAAACAQGIAAAARALPARFEARLRHKDGSERVFAWSAAAEEDRIYATGRDVTLEKRQAEQLQQVSAARLRLALEAGGMGAWEWDLASDEVLLLHGAAMLHGLPANDGPLRLPSMNTYLECVHPEDRPAVQAAIARVRSEGRNHRVEYRILRPDGSVRWIEARGTVHDDENGKPQRVSGVSVDITRRKRTEQDLHFLARASVELSGLVDLQSTLDRLAYLSVPEFADWCAIDVLGESGQLERVTVAHVDPERVQAAREIQRRFPPDPQQPLGLWSVIRSMQPQLVPEVNDALLDQTISDPDYRALLQQIGLCSFICVPLAAHGQALGAMTFACSESGRRFTQADLELAADLGRRTGIAIENARLYRALQQSDYGKDIFLATLAHELRNPLAAIATSLSILRLAPDDRRRVENSAAVMERQVHQLRHLVDDLLDVSRIGTGKIALRKEDADLVTIITNAVEAVRPQIEAARHKLSIALPGGSTRIHADPVRLAQVFANLIGNAAKYTNDGGQIDVGLDATDEEFIVSVRDNGIGIEPELIQNLFHIFRQGSHPLERSDGGLGIGLSLVDGLVRLHGGRVAAYSAGPGQGSEFTVHLPRGGTPTAEPVPAEPAPQHEPAPPRRVLVVDDNIDGANTVAELLRLMGHEVEVEHDGLGAVSAALRLRPDVVLLDIGLPGIDGYEAARRIRSEEGPTHMKLVALTGWGQDQDKERAFGAGFDLHCVKPVGLEQLQKLMES